MRIRRPVAVALAAVALAAALAGCGDDAAEPAGASAETDLPAPPAAPSPAAPGEVVEPGPATPAPVAEALGGPRVVVMAFLLPGPADDRSVAASLRAVRRDPASREAARFFVYRIGEDRDFGDLPEVLGVAGTPSVAVVARDGTLQNLWPGLVDAAMLRQSIADAADVPASAPGEVSGGGAADGGAAEDGGSVTGRPRGIALARAVNAAHGRVAGVRVSGTAPGAAGPVEVAATAALDGGSPSASSAEVGGEGWRAEIVTVGGATRVRAAGAPCWAPVDGEPALPPGSLDPRLPMSDARFSDPRAEGERRTLTVLVGETPSTWVVDPEAEHVTEIRTGDGVLDVETLADAPRIEAPGPVCDDPAAALDGLPEALLPS